MIYDDFFLLINMFSNFISFYFLFFIFFPILFLSQYLFYLNPKLLRIEKEIKRDGGRPQPVLPLTG